MARPRSSAPGGRDGLPVLLGPTAADGGVALPRGLVRDHADERPFGVEHADAGGVERHAPVRVGGAVDRVDHRQQAGRAVAGHARLLGQHGQPGAVEHREGRSVGGQVEPVLARLSAARAPVVQDVERAAHGEHRLIEHFQEPNVVHG